MTCTIPDDVLADWQGLAATKPAPRPAFDCEQLLTDPALFGLTTATNLQRAICRVATGVPLGELADDPAVRRAFGNVNAIDGQPHEMAIISGIRSAKSLIAACLAVFWSQTVDLSRLGPGETARVSCVSIRKDLAQVIFDHVRGRCEASPTLRRLIIGAPGAESIAFRHPSGRMVEVFVAAGARAGSSLVARWMAGVVFDEFPRMNGAEDGVINWDDQRSAVRSRILPGGGMMHIGSPWAPVGPAYEMVRDHLGKPTRHLVVVKAPGWDMNPVWWTPERCAEEKARDPDTFRTDGEAEFSTPVAAMFNGTEIERARRKLAPGEKPNLPPNPLASYRATMDPATRGNGWTLLVGTREGPKIRIAVAREWRGSRAEPLSTRDTMKEIAAVLRPYGVVRIESDQHLADALRDIAREEGLSLVQVSLTDAQKMRAALSVATMLSTDALELHPEPMLGTDMQRVRKKPLPGGGFKVDLPATSDGRHVDFWPSMALLVDGYIPGLQAIAPEPGSREALAAEGKKMREARIAQVAAAEREKTRPGRMALPPGWRRR